MTDLNADNIKEFFEQVAKTNADAWTSQAAYFEELVKRNTECFKELGDARMASFQEISEATTFNQAFESNLAFEEKVREELAGLQENNTKSWEALVKKLTAIYTPIEEAPKAKAKKPAAKQPTTKKAA